MVNKKAGDSQGIWALRGACYKAGECVEVANKPYGFGRGHAGSKLDKRNQLSIFRVVTARAESP